VASVVGRAVLVVAAGALAASAACTAFDDGESWLGRATSSGAGGDAGASSSTGVGAGGADTHGGGATTSSTATGDAGTCDEGFACVPAPPAGWTGPAALFRSEGPANAPACADGWADTIDGHSSPGGQASCTPCQCDAAGGCSVDVIMFGSSSCGGFPNFDTVPAGACGTVGFPFKSVQANVGKPKVTCEPSGGKLVGDLTITWGETDRVCGGTKGASCGVGHVCVPPKGPAFDSNACVYAEGERDCPPGYPTRTLTYRGADDQRACEACTCDASSFQCSTMLAVSSNADCSQPTIVSANGKCHDATGTHYMAKTDLQGSCAPSTTALTGAVIPTDPLTVCCP
jgi:hypothetical protein